MRYLFIVVAVFFCLSACQKMGCTDSSSMNFEEGIKKDDGSCVYSSQLTIWFSFSKSSSYQSLGYTELRYYLNNVYIGSASPTDYSPVVPNCSGPNTFSTTVSLGKIASRDYTLTVRNDLGNFVSTHGVSLKGNECKVFQLP